MSGSPSRLRSVALLAAGGATAVLLLLAIAIPPFQGWRSIWTSGAAILWFGVLAWKISPMIPIRLDRTAAVMLGALEVAVCVAAALLLCWGQRKWYFISDDLVWLAAAKHNTVQLSGIFERVIAGTWRPIQGLFWTGMYLLFGEHSWPYFLGSWILHGGVVGLALALVWQLGGGRLALLWTACLTMLAGQGIEAILWPSSCSNLFCTAFILLGWSFAIRDPGSARAAGLALASLGCLASKEEAAVAAMLLAVLAFAGNGRAGRVPGALALAGCVAYGLAQRNIAGVYSEQAMAIHLDITLPVTVLRGMAWGMLGHFDAVGIFGAAALALAWQVAPPGRTLARNLGVGLLLLACQIAMVAPLSSVLLPGLGLRIHYTGAIVIPMATGLLIEHWSRQLFAGRLLPAMLLIAAFLPLQALVIRQINFDMGIVGWATREWVLALQQDVTLRTATGNAHFSHCPMGFVPLRAVLGSSGIALNPVSFEEVQRGGGWIVRVIDGKVKSVKL